MSLSDRMRTWFGPSKEAIWRELSDQIGATYVEGGTWKRDRVEATHGEWTITLESYIVPAGKVMIPYTRLRAPYVSHDDFRFSVTRAGMFTELLKFFGMQDVEVGFESFDREFVIKGSDEEKTRALFADEELRGLLLAQPEVHFGTRAGDGWFAPKLPPDTDLLEFVQVGDIRDVDRLASLFELLSATLVALSRIGAAESRAP